MQAKDPASKFRCLLYFVLVPVKEIIFQYPARKTSVQLMFLGVYKVMAGLMASDSNVFE